MVKRMKQQVKELIYNELVITKSKFLAYLFPVSSLEEIKMLLSEYKEKYRDATHVCYAYILDENTFKYYDDGEPASTAGAPIYQTLKNNSLIYTMCVVIRYFGGTKLGVGGLVKAYTNSCLECIKKASIIPYEIVDTYVITVDYANYEKLEYYLKVNNITIVDKSFDEKIQLTISIDKNNLELLNNNFYNLIVIEKK